ncbi:endonuclease V [Limnoglobus roseus]|uniref:Endonuclease V n=1 Tax=Limnoglobus roseus TaxID=2598579 RepID=A0A5C1A4K8_9BACT|nr:endonuclease V [Limnoglobus roseus]QEL13263.1 endonuclease V [Limnoglobus roseus]
MLIPHLHDWPTTEAEALAIQHELVGRVNVSVPLGTIRTLAGCDIAYDTASPKLVAAVVVLDWPSRTVIEKTVVRAEATFPYVPGLLSFRELPALLEAFAQLGHAPDAFMLDAQGVAHPRNFGLACHLGLWLDRPCVGCAKSWLVGDYAAPGPTAGDTSPLTLHGRTLGSVVRSATNAKPVFVSPGHKIDAAGATALVLQSLSGYRHPVPTRLAHMLANEERAKL